MGPNYTLFIINLTDAGSQVINLEADLFHFMRADGPAGQYLDALIEVALGTATDDYLPIGYNGRIEGRATRYTLRWQAQPGVSATILVSWKSDRDNGVSVDSPPTKQVVTQASGSTLTAAEVAVGAVATVLRPAAGTRQSLSIRNTGATTVYVGPATVTTADGFPVEPDETLTLSGTAAPVYAVAAVGGTVRVLEEA